MKIGDFAKKFNVKNDTVRYYIELGILNPQKINNQYRFDENNIETMKEIIELKKLKFTLTEIQKIFLSLKEFNSEESSIHKSIIISAIRNMNANDNYENQHSENVASICLKIAKILNFSEEKTNRLYWAALIHDFGKYL